MSMTYALTRDGTIVRSTDPDAPRTAYCPHCGREVYLMRATTYAPEHKSAYVHADWDNPGGCPLHAKALVLPPPIRKMKG
jgi:hypothetical protein